MQTFSDRMMQIVRKLGRTEAERAAKLGYTSRQLDNWRRGQGIVKTLERMERAGVIHLSDGACACPREALDKEVHF